MSSRPGVYIRGNKVHFEARGREGRSEPPVLSLDIVEALDVAQQVVAYAGSLLRQYPEVPPLESIRAMEAVLNLFVLADEAKRKVEGERK